MTTEAEFNNLSFEERELLCIKHGRCVNAIVYGGHKVMLFAVDRLFIEVFYSMDSNSITDISILSPPERLNLYVRNIDISDIMK